MLIIFARQFIFGKELKAHPDELVRVADLREKEALVWSHSFRRANRFQHDFSTPIVRGGATLYCCSFDIEPLVFRDSKTYYSRHLHTIHRRCSFLSAVYKRLQFACWVDQVRAFVNRTFYLF